MRRFGLTITTLLVTVVVAGATLAPPARALPRYAARYNQKCSLCHVNPTGGGLRTLYASQYLVPKEIAWSAPDSSILSRIDPQIGKNLVVGTDMRMIQSHSDEAAQSTDFFEMQGDVYLAFELGKTTTLYYDRGITTTGELFGLAYIPPLAGGYVKVGRFIPSFGWKVDDHTMYVRDDLGFAPPGNSDVGIEIGASPGRLDAQVALTNGNRGSTIGGDGKYATSANVAYRLRVMGVGAAAGGAWYHEPSASGTFQAGGPRAYVTWKSLTWLGEVDWFRTETTAGAAFKGIAASHEVSYLAHQGLELLATFDFFDPDVRLQTGSRARWGAGVAVMPNPFLKLDAFYRRTTFDGGSALDGDDFYQTILQAHFLY